MAFKNIFKKAEEVTSELLGTDEIREIVIKFISAKKEGAVLDGDTNLFENGFVNSLFALDVVTFLEKTFKIRLGKNDITKDNLSTVNKIVALVERLKK